VDVLGNRGRDDLRRREPNALVDDLEPGVAGTDGDLLGTVRVPVQAGLADQQTQPRAELLAGGGDPLAHGSELLAGLGDAHATRHSGGGAVLAEHLTQGAGPLPYGGSGSDGVEGGCHQVRVGLGLGAQPVQRLVDGGLVALGPPLLDVGDGRPLGLGVGGLDGGVEVGGER
jgi:hypothetical protein